MPDTNIVLPSDLDNATRQAISNHPALKMDMAKKEAAEKSYDASKSSYFPEFGLELAASKNRNMELGRKSLAMTTVH